MDALELTVFGAGPAEPLRCGPSAAERRAIEALYREHAPPLRRFIRARVRCESDAEDVLQEVFVRLCRRGETGSLASPAAVLFVTGFRLALNVIRRRRNSPIDPRIEAERLEVDGGGRSPEAALIARQDVEALASAFAGLPGQCRKVLGLRALEGLSYDEMAERLGLSVSTLEKHVVKGRRLLREHRAREDAALQASA